MSNGLGRGLSSLIPQKIKRVTDLSTGKIAVEKVTLEVDKNRIFNVDPKKIKINPFQPRKSFVNKELQELVESIKQYGIIQPLIVTKQNDEHELIAGERRLRAAKMLNLAAVPVIIREAGQQEKLEIALIENLQREDLNAIERALAYRRLADEFNLKQEEVALRVGKSRPVIANSLRLLNLPEEIKQALIEKKIFESHAKLIVGLDTETKQFILFKKILHNNLTSEDTLQEARSMGGTKDARIKINYTDKDKEFAFREFFNTRVEIKRRGKGGKIIIDFYGDEELFGMVNKLKNKS
ncbi:MAG: ParB/RepB/Spo0J family partition protein [Patescibacteria group bacterium]|nr:ParB/RepB/Spo0J family partition protein [Patescibacteria group bacterium]MBU1870900.1 ParB/RepB/Spo0J family partition protein [Patescibacteria group bacterium]